MPPVDAAALLRVTREHRDETEACRWLLERVLEEVVALLREARLGAPATALGASLHLHDGAAFRLSLGQERREGAFSADHHASANVWAGLKEHAEALTLDVRARTLRARSGRIEPLDGPRQQTGTILRLTQSKVTHLLGLPLRAPGRGLLGMITVEIACRSAIGRDLGLFSGALGLALDELQLLVDLAALSVALLPPALAPAGPSAESAAHHNTLRLAEQVAPSWAPVGLVGPPGSGRAWLARFIHERSAASPHPLTPLDAHRVTPAELDLALRAPGTALIRDVHGLSVAAQGVLAAWLDDPSPARLIVTTTAEHDLGAILRFDLPRRLKLWDITVPGLHQRREDIPALVCALLADELGRPQAEVSDLLSAEALDVFTHGAYPSHLKDLRAAVGWAWRVAQQQASSAGRPLQRLRAEHARRGLHHLIPAPPAVLDQLRPGARALVERAAELLTAETPEPPRHLHLLALAEGFVGLVVAEALAASADPAEAAERLGLADQVKVGNHLKTLRAAEEKLSRLAARLHEPTPPVLARLHPRRKP